MRARSIIVAAVLLAAFWFQDAGIARAMMRDWVDDAFFYLIVADSVVEGRGSSSDGIGTANGYHPLWMAVHVLVRAATTHPLPVLAVLQFVLLAAALLLLRRWLAPLSGPGIALILDPLPYMGEVLGVPADALPVVASLAGTERNPRRYLVLELSP